MSERFDFDVTDQKPWSPVPPWAAPRAEASRQALLPKSPFVVRDTIGRVRRAPDATPAPVSPLGLYPIELRQFRVGVEITTAIMSMSAATWPLVTVAGTATTVRFGLLVGADADDGGLLLLVRFDDWGDEVSRVRPSQVTSANGKAVIR